MQTALEEIQKIQKQINEEYQKLAEEKEEVEMQKFQAKRETEKYTDMQEKQQKVAFLNSV